MDLFKRVNSKAFLLLYLVVFAGLLGVLVSQKLMSEKDERTIPAELAPYIVSPPGRIPQFLLYSGEGKVLTEQSLRDRWSFIYFSQPSCLPDCEAVFTVLDNLQDLSASNKRQFIVINYDSEKAKSGLPAAKGFQVYSADKAMMEKLTAAFAFLFLRTDFADNYLLEQQHSIFLTDPKGRVYARFEPPYTSLKIQAEFIRLRDFYARTE